MHASSTRVHNRGERIADTVIRCQSSISLSEPRKGSHYSVVANYVYPRIIYPRISANFGRFRPILLFVKMALIVLRVFIA